MATKGAMGDLRKTLLVIGGLVLLALAVRGIAGPANPTTTSAPAAKVDTAAKMPNVIGTKGEDAERTVEETFRNSKTSIELGGETYRYSVDNRCKRGPGQTASPAVNTIGPFLVWIS